MKRHVEALDPLELVPKTFLAGIHDDTGPFPEKELLDGDKTV
jgi:hypothetical protein